jgi:hypothetical protein
VKHAISTKVKLVLAHLIDEETNNGQMTAVLIITTMTESRVATVRMLAQETVCLHTALTYILMLSMTLKPLEFRD